MTGPRVAFPGFPPMPPQPELVPRAVNAAIFHAAENAYDNNPNVLNDFLALGLHVLQGRALWTSVLP